MKFLTFLFCLIPTIMPKPNFEIQGHRGCRGLMPENTLIAFEKALDLGVNTLEMDVVVSKDHQIVVSHDPFFNFEITTKPDGTHFKSNEESNLYLLDYAEIRKFDVGKIGNPHFPLQSKLPAFKPLLLDVINQVKKSKQPNVKYNIEIKSLETEYGKSQPDVKTFCDLFLKTIKNKIPQDKLCIQSFDFNVLQYLNQQKKQNKNITFAISALIEPEDNNEIDYNIAKIGFKPDIWSPYYAQLNLEKIEKLHRLGIKVIPWTVNEVQDMHRIFDMGCDGLISDYPDRAINIFKN